MKTQGLVIRNKATRAETILVVDHDDSSRASMVALLSEAGFACLEAHDASSGLACQQSASVDLIVADIQIPGNSRFEFVSEVAKDAAGPPIVLVTGRPSIETASAAIRNNAIGYLIKPLTTEDLLRLVRIGVDAHRTRQFLRRRRDHIERFMSELQMIDQALRSPESASPTDMLRTYLSLCIEHLHGAMMDLCELIEAVIRREGAEAAAERLSKAKPLILLNAVQETIMVLDRTKTSFKSKELAELRRKLETLLAGINSQ